MPNSSHSEVPFTDRFWSAPLAPVALLFTIGIGLDRYFSIQPGFSLLLSVLFLLSWGICIYRNRPSIAIYYLGLTLVWLGCSYNHYRFQSDPFLNGIPENTIVRLRGIVDEGITRKTKTPNSFLSAIPDRDLSRLTLHANSLFHEYEWIRISDRIRVTIPGEINGIYPGDTIEVQGRLQNIQGPKNPGEMDYRRFLYDQGIHFQIQIRNTGSITQIRETWQFHLQGWLSRIAEWAHQQFTENIHDPLIQGLALALVLGDNSALNPDEWQIFQRTGVIQVLVVSGQHLVILTYVLLFVLMRTGIPLGWQGLIVGILVFLYVMITGGRPPGMRSAIMMAGIFACWITRRQPHPGNLLCLAWIIVGLLNPMDLFSPGCQLSFLSVLALQSLGIIHKQFDPETQDHQNANATEEAINRTRPLWQQYLMSQGAWIRNNYLLSFAIWLIITPLVAYYYHNIPLVAIILNPILGFLTSIALMLGFGFLFFKLFWLPCSFFLSSSMDGVLASCDWIVGLGDWIPGSSFMTGSLNPFWLMIYLAGIIIFLTTQNRLLNYQQWLVFGLTLAIAGLITPLFRIRGSEITCTFLAVGHGGCTVFETPDGKTILYDIGSLAGPSLTRRQVIPYLLDRGIARIDEVILSHADLDHFNGLAELMDRFTVGQITMTPSFALKDAPGVIHTMDKMEQRKIPTRVVKRGDVLSAGNDIFFTVLHPPANGPSGKENNRSLTLRIETGSSSILLTGDLESEGLDQFLKLDSQPVDILMAPHHGSKNLDTEGLINWARPRLVISSQGPTHSQTPRAYHASNITHWSTEEMGAITIHIFANGIFAETFLTKEQVTLPSRNKNKK